MRQLEDSAGGAIPTQSPIDIVLTHAQILYKYKGETKAIILGHNYLHSNHTQINCEVYSAKEILTMFF